MLTKTRCAISSLHPFVQSARLAMALLALPPLSAAAFDLFHPVPATGLREMSTDRPDTTESPFTVDAGHYQLEMSFFDFTRDSGGGESLRAWSLGQVNLKAGLLADTDLQVVFDTWSRERTDGAGSPHTSSGFSDVTLRLKQNLWGNDGGTTAFAVMPYLKIPTGSQLSNSEWEGGLILPLSIELNDRVGLGLMAEADWVYDDVSGGHDLEWVHSATLGFSLTDTLGLYTELVGIAGEDRPYAGYFDTGLVIRASDNLCFDTGVRLGLNRAAEEFGVFGGMSLRF